MSRGFSILEVLLTIAIFSSIGAAATLSLAQWTSQRAVSTTAEHIRTALEYAYLSALSHQVPVAVVFETTHLQTRWANGTEFDSYTFPKGQTVKIQEAGQTNLNFYPSHTASPATVVITSPYRTCSVVVSLRGRIRSACR